MIKIAGRDADEKKEINDTLWSTKRNSLKLISHYLLFLRYRKNKKINNTQKKKSKTYFSAGNNIF